MMIFISKKNLAQITRPSSFYVLLKLHKKNNIVKATFKEGFDIWLIDLRLSCSNEILHF